MAPFLLTDKTLLVARKVVESAMDFTCDVEVPVAGPADTYGQDTTTGGFTNLYTALKCSFRLVKTEDNRVQADFTEAKPELSVPYGTSIPLTARILNVKDRDNQAVEPSIFQVLAITPRKASILLSLEAVD